MIYASLNAKEGNYQYPAAIKTALDFLAKPETAELPVGRYELDGDNIFVLIQDQTTDFQLNEMLLQLSEERFSDKKIGKIEVYRIEDGSTVTFDNVFSENGVKKSIRCSNILIRIMRNEE